MNHLISEIFHLWVKLTFGWLLGNLFSDHLEARRKIKVLIPLLKFENSLTEIENRTKNLSQSIIRLLLPEGKFGMVPKVVMWPFFELEKS